MIPWTTVRFQYVDTYFSLEERNEMQKILAGWQNFDSPSGAMRDVLSLSDITVK